jgi:hypothetical protein
MQYKHTKNDPQPMWIRSQQSTLLFNTNELQEIIFPLLSNNLNSGGKNNINDKIHATVIKNVTIS